MITMKKFAALSSGVLFMAVGFAAANQGGTSTASFLKIGQGARAEGMGGAFTAVANDARAVNWNPAGLAQITRSQITFDHLKYIEQINSESMAAVVPVNHANGTLGVAITYLDMGSIDRLDSSGNADSGENKVNAYAGTLSWGQAIGDRFALGAGAKFISQNLADSKGSGIAADVGALLFLIPDRLSLGASILNLGPKIETGTTKEDLPRTFQGGVALYAVPDTLIFAADVSKERDTAAVLHGGAEYVYQRSFVLRAGYQDNLEAGGGLSAGAGFIWHPQRERSDFLQVKDHGSAKAPEGFEVHFDYAYVDLGDFNATHRIGIHVLF